MAKETKQNQEVTEQKEQAATVVVHGVRIDQPKLAEINIKIEEKYLRNKLESEHKGLTQLRKDSGIVRARESLEIKRAMMQENIAFSLLFEATRAKARLDYLKSNPETVAALQEARSLVSPPKPAKESKKEEKTENNQ